MKKQSIFLKNSKKKKLFYKNKIIIFDGNLMHGNGINKSDLT